MITMFYLVVLLFVATLSASTRYRGRTYILRVEPTARYTIAR